MATTVPETSVSARLRALVVDQAAKVLTCPAFVPGGKFGGVGIRSHLYCANCSQGQLYHLIADGLKEIATAEDIIQDARAAARREGAELYERYR